MIHSSMTEAQSTMCIDISEDCGKFVNQIILVTTDSDQDFAIVRAYEEKLKQLNMTLGDMQRDDPRGIASADRVGRISKWRNIPTLHYHMLDGFVLCDDQRHAKKAFICLLDKTTHEDTGE